jgi:hypothetical protein
VSRQNYSNFYCSDSFESSFQNILRKQKIPDNFQNKNLSQSKKMKMEQEFKNRLLFSILKFDIFKDIFYTLALY